MTSVNTLTKFYTQPEKTANVLKQECIDCISEIEVLQQSSNVSKVIKARRWGQRATSGFEVRTCLYTHIPQESCTHF